MKLAFGHHLDLLQHGEKRPGTFGIHTAAENMVLHLRNHVEELDYLPPLNNRCTLPAAARIALLPKLSRKKYYGWSEPSLSRSYGRQLARKLEQSEASAVLCNEVKHVAYLHTDRKKAIWTDSLYGGLFEYYQTFSNLCSRTRRDMETMDRAAVANCDRLIFVSDWAAQRAIELYGADPDRISVVPYGANVTSGLSRQEAEKLTAEKPFDGVCRLLFTGVEWHRKGGDTAMKIVKRLNAQGIRTELTFLGTDPAKRIKQVPDWVNAIGFLSPSKPDELEKMRQLYRNAHFLLQPCRAECFGHIFPEANSFALPAIASNTGGIPTAVHESVNGYCFDPEAAGSYADCIGRLFAAPDEYRTLAMNAFDDYHARLTWDKVTEQVSDILSKA